jgi:protease I
MNQPDLDGLTVAILVANNFEQIELTDPRDVLQAAGARTMLVSVKAGSITWMNHDEKGDTFAVDAVLADIDPQRFDALLLPGGALNADSLRMVPEAQDLVRRFDADRKPMAVICHAPWLLVSAGMVRGRTLTSYFTIQDDIKNAGGNWVDRELVRDSNMVTSRSPKDLPAFNRGMIELFAEHRASRPEARRIA